MALCAARSEMAPSSATKEAEDMAPAVVAVAALMVASDPVSDVTVKVSAE